MLLYLLSKLNSVCHKGLHLPFHNIYFSASVSHIHGGHSPGRHKLLWGADTKEALPRLPNCSWGDWSFSVKIRSKQSRGLLGRCPQHYFLTSFIVSISLNQVKTEAVKSSCMCFFSLLIFSIYYNKWLWGILCNLLTLVFKFSKLLCLSPQLSQHPILPRW